jgi:N-acetylglucosamine-6-phosphate deacetylase
MEVDDTAAYDRGVSACLTRDELAERAPASWRVTPGLLDLQVNGAAGREVGPDRDANAAVAGTLPRAGVTAFLPTLVSRTLREYASCAEALATTDWPRNGARCLGVHLEGPFIAPSRRGAHHPAALLAPSPANVSALLRAIRPRAITLAPELPGAIDAIERLSGEGIAVFIGHTEADADTARAALAAGASMMTHAFNAMRGIETRSATALAALLGDRSARVSLIADGVHVHPENLAWLRPVLRRRLVLVSDAAAPAGSAPGQYRLGPRTIRFDGERVTAEGRLAGSGHLLDAGVRRLVAAGWPAEEALAAAAVAPREILQLVPDGDLVVWDERLRTRLTVIRGEVAYRSTEMPPALGEALS